MLLPILFVFLIGAVTGDVINTEYGTKADDVTKTFLQQK